MYRTIAVVSGLVHGLVNQTVAVPVQLIVIHLGQVNGFFYKATQGIGLRQRLTIQLVDPLCWAICRNHHQWHVLIISLSHSWGQIKQRSATGDTNHHWPMHHLGYTQGIESCTTLIRHWIALDFWALIQIVYDR